MLSVKSLDGLTFFFFAYLRVYISRSHESFAVGDAKNVDAFKLVFLSNVNLDEMWIAIAFVN
jgi:hypothetical protein